MSKENPIVAFHPGEVIDGFIDEKGRICLHRPAGRVNGRVSIVDVDGEGSPGIVVEVEK